jgi:hypothetical protein
MFYRSLNDVIIRICLPTPTEFEISLEIFLGGYSILLRLKGIPVTLLTTRISMNGP